MNSSIRLAGLAVGVSKPRSFSFGGQTYPFRSLPQADRDAALLRARLHTLAQATNEPLLMDSLYGRDATRERILIGIRDNLRTIAPGGLFIFILEGHGTQVPDLNGDEPLSHPFDQGFPTATGPIVDDDLWALWSSRPDVVIFTIADTCRAETITVSLQLEMVLYRELGARLPSEQPAEALIRLFITDSGPSVLQFAASTRTTDAGDIPVSGGESGRLTQALLSASKEPENLRNYRSWFKAADAIVRSSSAQMPLLYYRGPDPSMIDRRPLFVPG